MMPSILRRDRQSHPLAWSPGYKSTTLRSPRAPLISLEPSATDLAGPVFGHGDLHPLDNDLTINYARAVGYDGCAIGDRIIVYGRVMDQDARPLAGTLIEIWQANAGGRYRHDRDGRKAPLDPAFGGCGRCLTDESGHYAFRTIRPGPYPWQNHGSNWRPAHIHLSLFGHALAQRLVTQMYFEGDPLIPLCPIVATIPDPTAADRMTARLDLAQSPPFDALAWRFDIILRGHRQSFFENQPEGM